MKIAQKVNKSITHIVTVSASALLMCSVVEAAVLQVNLGLESNRIIDGLDVIDGQAALNLAADISFDNGVFTGGDCFSSGGLEQREGIQYGCNAYLGYFTPISTGSAISVTLLRSQNEPALSRTWNYTKLSTSWHLNQQSMLTVAATDDWFGRGYRALSYSFDYQKSLTEKLSANLQASVVNLADAAPRNAIEYAKFGLRYEHKRWTTELNMYLNDSDLRSLTPFSVSQPEVGVRLSYRLY